MNDYLPGADAWQVLCDFQKNDMRRQKKWSE